MTNHYGSIPIPDRTPGARSSMMGLVSSYQRAQSYRSMSLDPRVNIARSFFQDDEELVDPETFNPSPMGKKISMVLGARPSFDNMNRNQSYRDSTVFDDNLEDVSFRDYTVTDFVHSRQPSMISNMQGQGHSLSRVLSHDTDSLYLRQIDTHDGKTLTMIAPQSTVSQTIFNAINVLIGIGLLALSKAMTHAGWLFGLIFMSYSVLITYWTATLLSDCMDTDPTLYTYADLGHKAFGSKGRFFISLLFTIELCGVGVSLFVLFADSLHAIFPSVSLVTFKWIGFCILTPFSFFDLKVLSTISLFGIISTISLVFLVFFCGVYKTSSPGSLIDPALTNFYPPSLLHLFMSYGIILGPFGSHSLFPALKADLSKPKKFNHCLQITYAVGFFADFSMALIGFLMFGGNILNEITQSIIVTTGYPSFVYILVSLFVSVIPIAKTPINALPIINIIEFAFGLTHQQLEQSSKSKWSINISKSFIKIFVNLLFVICSILYPEFDKIIGLSGASLCSIICIILPCAFYIKLVKPLNTWPYYLVIAFGLICGLVSTYAALVI